MNTGQILVIFIAALVVILGSIIWYDYNCTTSHNKIVQPIVVINPAESHTTFLDKCMTKYTVYYDSGLMPFAKEGTALKLMYCKENNIPCMITITDHLFGSTGISNAEIITEQNSTEIAC